MSVKHIDLTDPAISAAIDSLKQRIAERYPEATFTTFRGDDPEGVYLRTIVDVDDPEDVLDTVMDRLLEFGDEEIPVYVIPVRPLGRADQMLKTHPAQPKAPRRARLLKR